MRGMSTTTASTPSSICLFPEQKRTEKPVGVVALRQQFEPVVRTEGSRTFGAEGVGRIQPFKMRVLVQEFFDLFRVLFRGHGTGSIDQGSARSDEGGHLPQYFGLQRTVAIQPFLVETPE